MVARLAAGLALAVACSGKPRTDEPTPSLPARSDAAPAGDDAAASAAPAADASRAAAGAAGNARRMGDLQVRVEWRDVPAAARSSPGRTPCHTPRAPSVAPTTTWGVPGALVVVDGVARAVGGAGSAAAPRAAGSAGSPGAAASPPAVVGAARITLADCTLTPRIATGSSLAITSAVDRPAKLVLRKRGALDQLTAGEPITVMLPIAGHTVTTPLDPGSIYSLETDAPEPEVAFIATMPAHVTDASGGAVVRDLAAGPHTVTAWLPPRAGQPARTGRGTATITAGTIADLTVTLAP